MIPFMLNQGKKDSSLKRKKKKLIRVEIFSSSKGIIIIDVSMNSTNNSKIQ